MDEYLVEHMRNLYGLNPDMPHIAFQFPRLPPSMERQMFKIHQDPARQRLAKDAESAKRLQDFSQAYQRHASGLFAANSKIIPPGHPLHTSQDSISTLKAENDRLLKDNMELRKRLEKQRKD